MTHLTAARSAIEAELRHAEAGAAFYQQRVAALRQALTHLDDIASAPALAAAATGNAAPRPAQKRVFVGRDGVTTAPAKTRTFVKRDAAKPAKAGKTKPAKLPTPYSLWLEVIDGQPRTAIDIAQRLIAHMKLGADQAELIKGRVGPILSGMVKNGMIQDAGSGKGRTYWRAAP